MIAPFSMSCASAATPKAAINVLAIMSSSCLSRQQHVSAARRMAV
jgi:hypothetical protein